MSRTARDGPSSRKKNGFKIFNQWKTSDVLPIISIVLILLMIIAIPSFAQFMPDDAIEEFDPSAYDQEIAGDFDASSYDGSFLDDFDLSSDDPNIVFDFDPASEGDFMDDFDPSSESSFTDDFDPSSGGFDDSIGDGDIYYPAEPIDDDGFDGWLDDGLPGDDPFDLPDDSDQPPELPSESADMRLETTDSPDPIEPGNTLTYTIRYSNVGYSDAETVIINADYDPNIAYQSATPAPGSPNMWSLGRVEPQTEGTITINAVVDANAQRGSTLSTRFYLNYVDTATGQSYDVSASAGTTVQTQTPPPPEGAQISFQATDTPDPVEAGETITYTLSIENTGEGEAEDVELYTQADSRLLNAAWDTYISLDEIDSGETQTVTLTADVDDSTEDNTILTSTFTLNYYDSAEQDTRQIIVNANTRVDNEETTGPECGNRVIEEGEQCEPPGTSTCNAYCQIISQPGPEPSPPEESEQDLSLKILSTSMPFVSAPGTTIPIYLTIENNGAEKLEDTKITVLNQELAIRTSIGPFDLGRGDTVSKTLLLSIPEYIPYRTYMLRFTISSNSQMKRVVYRDLDIVSTLE